MEEITAQGILDTFFLDKSTIEKIKQIIASIDADKIKKILNNVEFNEEGWLCLKIDLRIKK
jgi:hypothetical protein